MPYWLVVSRVDGSTQVDVKVPRVSMFVRSVHEGMKRLTRCWLRHLGLERLGEWMMLFPRPPYYSLYALLHDQGE